MNRPCKHCPFRSDREFWLGADRRREIGESLLNDAPFSCHETITFDEEGRHVDRVRERFCIGALLFVENVTGSMFANVQARIAYMSKQFAPEKLDRSIPVFQSLEEFVSAGD